MILEKSFFIFYFLFIKKSQSIRWMKGPTGNKTPDLAECDLAECDVIWLNVIWLNAA